MRRASVRNRLLIATALPPLALLVTYMAGIPLWSLYIEDRVFMNIVSAQLSDAQAAQSDGRDLAVPLHGERVFRGPDALPATLTEELLGKGPGIHELQEIEIDGRTTDAFIGISEGRDPAERLYVLLDVGALEALRTKTPAAIILLLIAATSGAMLLTGVAISRSVLQSVKTLSNLARSPADSPVELPNDELGALGRGWLDARVELEMSANRQRRFARNVSHELRTPISVASGALELLERHGRLQEHRKLELVQRARTALTEMRELVEVFMGVAQDASSGTAAQEALHETVRQVLVDIAETDSHLGERVTLTTEATTPVDVPRATLSIVVRHLVINAVRHSPPGSPIAVHVHEHTVSVANPVGAARSSDDQGHYGVGLQVLQELVDSVGWSIKAERQQDAFMATVDCNPGATT